jgi:hypothetical protein
MFDGARRFWRRLTGQEKAVTQDQPAGDLQEDRRTWARFEADMEVTCQPSGAEPERTMPARLRNISRGGINLVLNHSFQPGELLTVHLPGQQGKPPVALLACVVHAQPTTEGDWALGCSFAEELSEADLRSLGANRTRTTPPDVRTWARYPCDVQAVYRVVTGETGAPRTAAVVNISPRGIALETTEPLETGTLLSAELQGRTGQPLTILACVVHASRSADNKEIAGCSFIRELTEADLRSLL